MWNGHGSKVISNYDVVHYHNGNVMKITDDKPMRKRLGPTNYLFLIQRVPKTKHILLWTQT